MRNFSSNRDYNNVKVEGVIFNHSLQARVTKEDSKVPGTEYITGAVNIVTDEEGLNVVPVNFGYVTRFYAKPDKDGKLRENDTYNLLKKIIDTDLTVEKVGKDGAMIVRAQCDIECNDFVARNGDMVAQQRVRGSFIHEGSRGDAKATFDADMLISEYVEREVEDGDNYGVLKGYVFNYRNDFLPATFNVRNKDGMKYFDSMDISNNNPLLTHVWGDINTSVVEVETGGDTAFGAVRTSSRSFRSWDVVGAAGTPYEFGDEEIMTYDDIKNGLENREQHLAQVRAREENRRKANSNGGSAFESNTVASPTAKTNFKF